MRDPDRWSLIVAVICLAPGAMIFASLAFGAGPRVLDTQTSPDGQWRVELADFDSALRFEVYATPSVGGTRRRISATPIHDYDVSSFEISADSKRVVYRFGRTATGAWALYSTPISAPSGSALSAGMDYVEDGFRLTAVDVHFRGSKLAGEPLTEWASSLAGGWPWEVKVFSDGFNDGTTGGWR